MIDRVLDTNRSTSHTLARTSRYRVALTKITPFLQRGCEEKIDQPLSDDGNKIHSEKEKHVFSIATTKCYPVI